MSSASQIFTSGKLNEVMNLFAGEVERLSAPGDDGRFQTQALPRRPRRIALNRNPHTLQHELPRGAPLLGRSLAQSAMQLAWDVEAGADRLFLHFSLTMTS